jgi:putative phage-type endonuclease
MERTDDPARAKFLEERRSGIGGSDAAAAIGLSPYRSPYELWLEKTGELEPLDLADKEAVFWGTELEPFVCDAFARREGKTVRRVNAMLRHKDHAFMVCHLDRRVVGEKAIVEAKTAGAHRAADFGEPGTDEIPEEYLIQCQHNMAVAGAELAYVPVLLGGQKLETYVVKRDEILIGRLVTIEAHFWDLVLKGEAPGVRTSEDARSRYKLSTATQVTASSLIEETVAEIRTLQKNVVEAEELLDRAKGQVMGFMAEADTLVDLRGNTLAKWSTVRSVDITEAKTKHYEHFVESATIKIDTAKFKKAIGAKAYDALLKPSDTRRFSLAKEA